MFGFTVESIDYCNRLIAEGHEHIAYVNKIDQCDDAAAMKEASSMFQINSDVHNSNSSITRHKLTSFPSYAYVMIVAMKMPAHVQMQEIQK